MKTRPFPSNIELLEARIAPAALLTIREASAAGPEANARAGILATVNTFIADLGGINNGNTPGSQGNGRREISWDGADNDAAPARLPDNFFNAVAPRGAIFGGDPRLTFQVSADATPAVPGTSTEFGNLNPTYPTAFSTFSSPRLFTALTSNSYEIAFFIPGTDQPAGVSGFGAIFTDVDNAGTSKIEFFDRHGALIMADFNGAPVPLDRTILASPGNESLSFLGIKIDAPIIAKVRITAGESAPGPDDITQGGTSDIVVFDNFIYGEPQPLSTTLVKDRTVQVFGDNLTNKISVKVGTKEAKVDIDGYTRVFNALDFDGILVSSAGGDDTIKVTGKPGSLTVLAGDGNNVITGTALGRVDVTTGGGNDTIKISGKPTELVVSAGDGNDVLSGTAIGQVVFQGEGGNDILKVLGKPAGSIVDGGAGDDTITGSGSRDVVFGGTGLDTIKSGAGEDVLVGGGGAFSVAQLQAILTEWVNAANDFVARMAILQAGSSSFPALADANLADIEVDVLDGAAGSDWFLANAQAEIKKLEATDVFTPIT